MRAATIIDVDLPKRGGTLGEATQALAAEDVPVLGFSFETGESLKTASIVTTDVDRAMDALDEIGIGRRVRDGLLLPAPADAAEMRKLGERLAAANVSVESGFMVPNAPSRAELALGVDDVERAREAIEGAPTKPA